MAQVRSFFLMTLIYVKIKIP